MSQIPLNNISLSILSFNLYNNKNTPIKFSDLYNYNTDSDKKGEFKLSTLASKYRTFIPKDNTNTKIWFENINLSNTNILYNKINNNFNAIINNNLKLPIYNKYGFNMKPALEFYNSSYYNLENLNNIQFNNLTIAIVFYSKSYTHYNLFTGGIFEGIYNFLRNNDSSFANYSYHPCIYIFRFSSISSIFRYNGNNINMGFIMNLPNNLNNINLFKDFNGSISELIIIDEYLNDINTSILEAYLSSKWFGVPSYLLNDTQPFNNIAPLNIINSPQILYNFDKDTITNNNIILNNYGIEGNNLLGTITNNYEVFNLNYSTNINNLIIWYKFDGTIENFGSLGSDYNYIVNYNTGGNNPIYDTNNVIRGISSIKFDNNSYISIPLNYVSFVNNIEYTISFWYKINSQLNNSDILLNISNDATFELKNDGNNNLIFKNIIIYNASVVDNKWKNIVISMKKINNNMSITIFYNSILFVKDVIINNNWLITSSLNNYIYLNHSGGNINYDDFKIYNRCLSNYEIQEILGLSISQQQGINNNDAFSYLWNYNKFLNNNTSSFKINYNNFINTFITNKNIINISFNLKIYNNSFDIITLFQIVNILKISIIYINSSYYIDIKYVYNDLIFKKSCSYIYDNLNHQYSFSIKLDATEDLEFKQNTSIYIDGINQEAQINQNLENDYVIDTNNNSIYVGNYYNINYTDYNTSPFNLENLQIYNYDNINYINQLIYNKYPSNDYYKNNLFPFIYFNLNKGNNPNINIGPIYNILINSYNYYNKWINNINFFNVYNGIQNFRVPADGYYNLIVAGASGGLSYTYTTNRGKGIILSNTIYLQKNHLLYIAVGQKGGDGTNIILDNNSLNGQGGGGGCSIIYNYTLNQIILLAGGGGGNGEFIVGKDAVNITSGTKDSKNIGKIAIDGNGGYNGLHSATDNFGCGGGGFYTNAEFIEYFSGISFTNIMNGNNLSIPPNTIINYGGYGGFPCGATGGTNYNFNSLIWGGGGGGGYSGGSGGSPDINGITLGGGGGGSYDILSINNTGSIIKTEGTNGYNTSDGYVNIKYLTNDNYLDYSNSLNNIRNGLIILLEIFNNYCFNNIINDTILINLVNANIFRFSNNNLIKENNYIKLINNNLLIKNNNINSLCIMYKINTNTTNKYIIDLTNIILENKYFINNINDNINWNYINNADNTWKFITLTGNFNNNTIKLFDNISNIFIKTIIAYNRIITFEEHFKLYNLYI